MKLHLGCGFDHREGYLNVDYWQECMPDLILDLEVFPWPFKDGSVTHILARHVLEHLGADLRTFQRIWQELYRIAAPACEIEIHLPYYKSVEFWADPTHVRVYTPLTFDMMSKVVNRRWIDQGSGNSKLAMMFDVDFEVVQSRVVWESKWQARLDCHELNLEQLVEVERNSWNVVKELHYCLRACKSGLLPA